jgi:hypothetical protein
MFQKIKTISAAVFFTMMGYGLLMVFWDSSYTNDVNIEQLEPFVPQYIEEALQANGKHPDVAAEIRGPIVVVREAPPQIYEYMFQRIHRGLVATRNEEARTIVLVSYRGIREAYQYNVEYAGRTVSALSYSWTFKIIDRESRSIIYEENLVNTAPTHAGGLRMTANDIDFPGTENDRNQYQIIYWNGRPGVIMKGYDEKIPARPRIGRPLLETINTLSGYPFPVLNLLLVPFESYFTFGDENYD